MKQIDVYHAPGKRDMKRILFLAVIFVFILSLSASYLAPALHSHQEVDLVKLKKEEEERRKKLKEQNKKSVVVTNDTLKQYEDKTKKDDKTKAPEKKKKQVTPTPVPKNDDPTKTKEYWQEKKNNLEKRISDLKKRIEATELELNRLTTEHLIMDLPQEKEQLQKQKDETQRLLDGQKATLVQLQAEQDALFEAARKAGVPPGWLR